jgi:hypothetical protein
MDNPSSQRDAIVFRHPPGARLDISGTGAIVCVPPSSGVALDETLMKVWQLAEGRPLRGLVAILGASEAALEEQLAVLRVAGLLLPPLAAPPPGDAARLPEPLPLVSVVIVSRDGRHHLVDCLPSLMAQTYPRIEVIVVDDQSSDGTDGFLRQHHPTVKLVRQIGGSNFAAGNNQGIRLASGDLVLLLNNDTILDSYCVQEMVAAHIAQPSSGGVAAMLRFYDNRPFVNGLGTFVPRRRFGHDVAIGSLDVGQFADGTPVPLLCFGAALIPRWAFEQVGLLDEAYEFYYEDADWSYRARVLGLDLIAAPRAKAYHKFGASTGNLPSAFKIRLATRNRLRFVLKNLPARSVIAEIMLYQLDDVLRLLMSLSHGQGSVAMAILRAWVEFARGIPRTLAVRRRTWEGRARKQVDLYSLAERFPLPELHGPYPRLIQHVLETRYRPYLAKLISSERPQRVLVISPDVVDVNMGGVGMRYWELARTLAEHAQVTLAVPNQTTLEAETLAIRTYDQGRADTLKPLVDAAHTVVLSGFVIYHHPFLRHMSQHCIVDLYDPTVLENLERFSTWPLDERRRLHQIGVTAYSDLFALGDFFICASEKQRDYWLGALSVADRVNPDTHAADPTLRRLIDVVPFGLPEDPPQHTRRVLKGVHPGIGENDKVILWGGGLWDWLDPLTAIEAMPAVLDRVPQARLFFMGTRHPNPAVPASRMAQLAIERAERLDLKDRAVFFNDWVPYLSRANYLLEADVGISLHFDHIEARFSVRTRLMDYIWASLPTLVTGGDTLSDLIGANGLGQVVAPGHVNEVSGGLIQLLCSPIDRIRFRPVADTFRWSRVAEPLVRYVVAPWRNGERVAGAPSLTRPVTPLAQLPRKALATLSRRGPVQLLREIRSYLIWWWERS